MAAEAAFDIGGELLDVELATHASLAEADTPHLALDPLLEGALCARQAPEEWRADIARLWPHGIGCHWNVTHWNGEEDDYTLGRH